MSNPEKYSLWFVPEGKVYQDLVELINDLVAEYGSPVFEPHITLLPDIQIAEEQVIKKVAQLSNQLKSFNVKLSELGFLDEYFKCLFLKVEASPEILKANNIAKEVFERQQDPQYLPHLSILYGNFSSSRKEQTIKKLGQLQFSFTVEKVYIYTADGSPDRWQSIAKFPLS